MFIGVKKEALNINGLFSMNAKGARWYAFCYNGDTLTTGEFVWRSEGIPTLNHFDGYIDLRSKEIIDLRE